MTWTSALPVVGVAVLLLVVPGVVVARAGGVRGVLLLGVAPLASVSVAGLGAVVAQLVGVAWGWPAYLGSAVVAAAGVWAAAAAVGWLLRRRHVEAAASVESVGPTDPGDPWTSWAWAVGGAVVGGTALAAGVASGLRSPDRWPQTFDAVFHLDAAWHVVTTGDGSSLTLGRVAAPEAVWRFYPAAWHDLVALVAEATGTDVVTATSVTALVTVGVAWPLACVALARVALGSGGPVLGAAGVLAAAVTASPVLLVSYGTLWPNALSTAVLPAALALVLASTVRPVGGRRDGPVALLALTVPGLALAHPNGVVALVVLGVAGVGAATWSRGRRARAAAAAAVLGVLWLVGWSPLFAGTRATSWGARQTTGQALGEWLALAPERTPVPLVAAVLAVVGIVVAWRRKRLRWLVVVHAVGGGLWVLVAGSDGRLSRLVSGPWYDDANRLGALVGVAGVPLAALGLVAVAEHAVGWWGSRSVRRGAAPDHARASSAVRVAPGARPAALGGVVLALLGVVTVATGGLYRSESSDVVRRWADVEQMLGGPERSLVASVGRWVPAGERVAGNPWDGMGFTGPLADREAVFPHLAGRWGADRELLASSLSSVATRPDVCAALDRLDVRYVLVGASTFWPTDRRRATYAGLEVAGRPGFEEVARSGTASLWRVTACG